MIADLQNQQAAAVAQNPAPALAPIPTLAPTPRLSKVYVTKPPDFDGNDYNTFKQVIEFYLLAVCQDFAVKQDQILFVLLYMKRGYVGIQTQNYQANYINQEY